MTKRPFLQVHRRDHPWAIYGPVTVFRASKTGGPLLKEEVRRFRDISGFMIQTRTRRIMLEFRRRG